MTHCFGGRVSALGLVTPILENASTASIIASGLTGVRGTRVRVCGAGVDGTSM
jgi:hypothetical protein